MVIISAVDIDMLSLVLLRVNHLTERFTAVLVPVCRRTERYVRRARHKNVI